MKTNKHITVAPENAKHEPRDFSFSFRHAVAILTLLLSLCYVKPLSAQVPVLVGPEPQTQFLDMTGVPLASGIVCTYAAGTSTPKATYTDSTGSTPNSNPVVLDAAGRANIWWQAGGYKVVLAGGGTCASPSNLQWTVDGFSVGLFAAGNNTFSGTNTFNGPTIFNGSVTINNGGSFNGTFTGNPNFSGNVTFSGSLSVSQLTLTIATGTPPLVVTSTTVVPNLNVEIINGVAYPASPSLHSVPVITSTNVATYKVIPDCAGANSFVQFTQSTNAFSCGATAFSTPTVTLKSGSKAGNYTMTGSATDVDGTNLSYTVVVPVGWSLAVATSGAISITASAHGIVFLNVDGSNVNDNELVGAQMPFAMNDVIVGDGSSHTIKLQMQITTGGTCVIINTSTSFPTISFLLTPTL